MDELKTKIRGFLARFFRKHELKDDEDIFATGLVNSLFAMQIVLFLEKEFKVKVENKDLKLDNFRSINALVSFVQSKCATNA